MRTLIITVYIGPLPNLMPLWLRSAGCNPQIDFLVVTDQPAPEACPPNVRFASATLASLAATWSRYAGFEVALATPYKLNDFKPMFWVLAEDLERYDYWGYCDLDVVFGNLTPLCEARLGRYDMVLSEGHLRLLRNDERTREAWRAVAAPRTAHDILTDPANFGMDEHHGINRVFEAADRSWFADSALVADIDPSFRQFRRLAQFPNAARQAFYWDDGRIFREYIRRGERHVEEYAYIHLQKRRLTIAAGCTDAASFNIDPVGLMPRKPDDASTAAIRARNPWRWPTAHEARVRLRELRRRMLGAPPQFARVDRPGGGS